MKKLVFGALALLSLAAFAYFYVPAQAGDTSDPIVTRSFVEARIAALAEELAQLRGIVGGLSPGALPAATPSPSPGIPADLDLGDLDELFALVIYYFESVYGDRLEAALRNVPAPGGDPFPPQNQNEFRVLNPQAGQTITFESGTEVILRGGRATALTGPYNGIPNVTAGADVMNGANIELNHLMIFPVSDGRGFVFQSESWIMVRGGFNIIS